MVFNIDEKKARYERKFFISGLDKHAVEAVIKANFALFSEAFYERYVNNIYFDSEDMDSYNDNQAGVSERQKVRIRWYGKINGMINKPVLEIKIKNNAFGSKLSYLLKAFKVDNNLSKEFLVQEVFSKSNLPAWLIDHIKSLRFVLLNRYKRKYFESADKRYRITLDSDLEFYDLNQRSNTFLYFIKENNSIILELKYPKEADMDAQQITNQFPFRLTKSSKYVIGIENL